MPTLAEVEWPDVLREIEGGKQRAIAGYAGVTQQAVSDWFALKTFPDAESITALAHVLGESEDELAGAVQRAHSKQKPLTWRGQIERRLDVIEERLGLTTVDVSTALEEFRGLREQVEAVALEEFDADDTPAPPRKASVPRPSRSRAR